MMASGGQMVDPSMMAPFSTTPTAKPARSYSPGAQQARVLRRLSADEGATRLAASLDHALHDLGHPLRHYFIHAQVVEKKRGRAPQQMMSSAHMATRSMPMVSCLSIIWASLSLVPTPSAEDTSTGFFDSLEPGVEEAGEPAQPAEHLLGKGRPCLVLDEVHRPLARFHVHAGVGIGREGWYFRFSRLESLTPFSPRPLFQPVLGKPYFFGDRDGVLAIEAGQAELLRVLPVERTRLSKPR